MVTLLNAMIASVSRLISSGDAGAPLNPPLTTQEIQAGGRLDQFVLATAQDSSGNSYQWTFTYGTSEAAIQSSISSWFTAGTPTSLASPMLSAAVVPPSSSWSM